MGTGSSKSQTQKGATRTHRQTPQQVQRGLRTTRNSDRRLRKSSEHERVRRDGRRIQLPLLTLWRASSELPHARVAVVVPLHGQSAVARNRLKRQLRHILESEILPAQTLVFDAIVSARPGAYAADFKSLQRALAKVFSE